MEILYWRQPQVYDSRFEEQQKKKHDVQNRFLPNVLNCHGLLLFLSQ